MSELIGKRKEKLKEILSRLHAGESPERLKEEFKLLLGTVTPLEISQLEAELVAEGTPREKLERLCDVHMALFRGSLDKGPSVPTWHPVHILMEEHKRMLETANHLWEFAKQGIPIGNDEELKKIAADLEESNLHYLREENVLFPYLEKHGITEPPAIMWMEHDRIRAEKRAILGLIKDHGSDKLLSVKARSLSEVLAGHFKKENQILFPSALETITEQEWHEIREQFDEIGYTSFTPTVPEMPVTDEERESVNASEDLKFSAGALSPQEIEAIFDNLPIDITFIAKDDTVRYFSQTKERIFVRSKAIIGRKVQNCHPQKSVHVVNQILDDFKTGRRSEASFWINLSGRMIYIRYFPVRGSDGEYLGTLEVTQDITDVRSLSGEKKLLDEKESKGGTE
jgi:hypothetical protein